MELSGSNLQLSDHCNQHVSHSLQCLYAVTRDLEIDTALNKKSVILYL